ncbi:hypothetical protein T05_3232 [Trichinella murrelli]|uniref:Uncharacterized protein n=1 Tax=Trichinella murrelli TaxID=144512 RepID=A0A0V0U403_9BILA|nr:hypothetical protein T05_3232 [Trichinella murrelli]
MTPPLRCFTCVILSIIICSYSINIFILKILTGAPIKHVDAKVITVYNYLIIVNVILVAPTELCLFLHVDFVACRTEIKLSHIYFPVTTTSTARRSAQTAVFTISARSQGQSPVTERELDKIFQLDFK